MNRLSIILCAVIMSLIVFIIISYKEQSCKKCLEHMVASECNAYRESRNTVVG